MTTILTSRISQQTDAEVGPYWYQEWSIKRALGNLIADISSLVVGKPASFHSAVATSSGEITVQNDLWKSPIRYIDDVVDRTTENETRIDKDYETELELLKTQGTTFGLSTTPGITEEDILDWDAHIETPPAPSVSGTIKVRFKYIGRSKPIPIENPWA